MTRVRTHMSAAALLVGIALASSVRADDAIDAWARWALTPKVWKGDIVRTPEPAPRPDLARHFDSLELPLRVYAAPDVSRGASSARAAATLAALERSYRRWRDAGWSPPAPAAGFGGAARFDLYALAGLARSDARVDRLEAPSDFDAAQTYALVPIELSPAQREACVQSAFAQAALRALEPAEAASWVRATGEFSAWHQTGEAGCGDSLVLAQQAAEHSLLGDDLVAAGSGALWLAFLSERHDGGNGDFVRALWELARQRSKGLVPDDQLRGSPDLWEVIARVLESAGEKWSDAVEEFGVARFFAGDPARRGAAAYRVFAGLPADASVPLLADLELSALPRRVRTAADGGIEALASAYVRLRVADDAACVASGCELRVWLRGELGPRWSLAALRLGRDGRELGRTRAPARDVPESYLPLAITPDTREVVLVISPVPRSLPDADRVGVGLYGVEVTLDRLAAP